MYFVDACAPAREVFSLRLFSHPPIFLGGFAGSHVVGQCVYQKKRRDRKKERLSDQMGISTPPLFPIVITENGATVIAIEEKEGKKQVRASTKSICTKYGPCLLRVAFILFQEGAPWFFQGSAYRIDQTPGSQSLPTRMPRIGGLKGANMHLCSASYINCRRDDATSLRVRGQRRTRGGEGKERERLRGSACFCRPLMQNGEGRKVRKKGKKEDILW